VWYSRVATALDRAMAPRVSIVRFLGIDVAGHSFLRFVEPQSFGDVSDDDRRRYGRALEWQYAWVDERLGELIARHFGLRCRGRDEEKHSQHQRGQPAHGRSSRFSSSPYQLTGRPGTRTGRRPLGTAAAASPASADRLLRESRSGSRSGRIVMIPAPYRSRRITNRGSPPPGKG
jgi:hypothetical protein